MIISHVYVLNVKNIYYWIILAGEGRIFFCHIILATNKDTMNETEDHHSVVHLWTDRYGHGASTPKRQSAVIYPDGRSVISKEVFLLQKTTLVIQVPAYRNYKGQWNMVNNLIGQPHTGCQRSGKGGKRDGKENYRLENLKYLPASQCRGLVFW